MVYDSAATRGRILAAATAEFAAHGLAGGRVDRIAAAAPANKKQIYVHFGSKEALFDVVVASTVDRLIAEVPLTSDNLAGYAGRIFEAITANPHIFRLAMWRQLERPIATNDEKRHYEEKINTLTSDRGDLPIAADTVLATILALAQMWFIASPALDHETADSTSSRRDDIELLTSRLFPTIEA